MSTRGLSALQNKELEEGISGNNNSDSNNSRPAGRQEQAAEFGEEMSCLRQEN
jgi:hypothetical protein